MSYFIKSGNTFRVSANDAIDLHKALPVGNYVIKEDPHGNLYLESIDRFEFKGKKYGSTDKDANRIFNTYQSRDTSTGVMLTGEKGSGKTLLAKTLSIMGYEQAMPTIVINSPWTGDKFNTLIQTIDQPCIILFDEFEKVYDSDKQQEILTLMDGVFPSKKMFVITCNDKWRVDQHMRNRPGRIFYMLDFKGLTIDFIVEYCEDNLNDKTHIEKINTISSLFSEFNFDMLKALVEEMNRYNESPQEAMRMLNAKPEFSDNAKYKIRLFVDGLEIGNLDSTEWNGNPLSSNRVIDVGYDSDPDGDTPNSWKNFIFSQRDLHEVKPRDGIFVFKDSNGVRLSLTKIEDKSFNYHAF